MARGNWVGLAEEIAQQIRALHYDQSIRLTLDEILERLGADAEPSGFRSRSQWASLQRGDHYWRAFRDAGLVINFEPD
jgi:hypothetical protein